MLPGTLPCPGHSERHKFLWAPEPQTQTAVSLVPWTCRTAEPLLHAPEPGAEPSQSQGQAKALT